MESPVRKMLKRNDYNRHKLFRKIKRRRKAAVEQQSKAAEKELKRRLRWTAPKFDMGLNMEDERSVRERRTASALRPGVRPRPINRERDSVAYDESVTFDQKMKQELAVNREVSKQLFIYKKLKQAAKNDRYVNSVKRAQNLFAESAKPIITSELIQEAVNNQVAQKQEDFKESKHNWALMAKSIGAIGDGAALASVYGGFRAERELAKLMAERNGLLNSGGWGFNYNQRMNQLNSAITQIERKLNAPNYVQMFGGSLGATANGVQLGLGEGDLLDVVGAVGGISSLVGGAQILRGGGWGNKADSFIDRLGYGLQGIDLTKTLFEVPTGKEFLPPISQYYK